MPKSVAVDMHALLDVVEVEREARVCPLVRVYRPGMEPLDWHLQHWQYGDAARFGADRDAALAPTCSAYHRVTASRFRSPVCRTRSRFARGGSDAELPHRGVLEEWNGHFDGVIRPFRDGFVLGVDDALVDDDADRCRSVFVDAFRSNSVLRGDDILGQCLRRHLACHRWQLVMHMCDALRQVARAELCEGPAGALRFLSV